MNTFLCHTSPTKNQTPSFTHEPYHLSPTRSRGRDYRFRHPRLSKEQKLTNDPLPLLSPHTSAKTWTGTNPTENTTGLLRRCQRACLPLGGKHEQTTPGCSICSRRPGQALGGKDLLRSNSHSPLSESSTTSCTHELLPICLYASTSFHTGLPTTPYAVFTGHTLARSHSRLPQALCTRRFLC